MLDALALQKEILAGLDKTVAEPVVIDPTKKPSYILRNAPLPQIAGPMFQYRTADGELALPCKEGAILCGACAIGAISYAVLSEDEKTCPCVRRVALQDATGIDFYQVVVNPVVGTEDDLASVIIALNDAYTWTFPLIADWLESIGL